MQRGRPCALLVVFADQLRTWASGIPPTMMQSPALVAARRCSQLMVAPKASLLDSAGIP
jgi:hypothetical protein